MSYTHDNRKPITLRNDPIDPDGSDWLFFSYGDWLRTGESITDHAAYITDGTISTDSIYVGTMTDSEGAVFNDVYGVQFSAEPLATSVTVTHRVSTETTGDLDLGRLDIDHSAIIKVTDL